MVHRKVDLWQLVVFDKPSTLFHHECHGLGFIDMAEILIVMQGCPEQWISYMIVLVITDYVSCRFEVKRFTH